MREKPATRDPVELTRVFEWVQGEIVRIAGYLVIEQSRAAGERLAEERADA